MITFTATLRLGGKTATGIHVPDDVVERLGGGRRPAVHATIGEHAFRITLGVRDGAVMLPVSAEHREAAGVAAGDEVVVGLALDTEPREVVVPDDLARALDAEPAARAFFDGLANSKRRAFADSVAGAKTDETRQRRIAKTVEKLREGRDR